MQKSIEIDDYIAKHSEDVQKYLIGMRKIISEVAQDAEEAFTYGMPTFKMYGNLVHFAACKNHLGFYPAPSAIVEFDNKLKKYTKSKGSIHFLYTEPLPIDLIKEIVSFRIAENIVANERKLAKKAKPAKA